MRTLLTVVLTAAIIVIAAVVFFPGSPTGTAAGWVLHLVLAVMTRADGLAVLGVLAAGLTIWWVLAQNPENETIDNTIGIAAAVRASFPPAVRGDVCAAPYP